MYYRLNERVVNSGNYIKDILEARGINNIDEYLNPSKEDLFPAEVIFTKAENRIYADII